MFPFAVPRFVAPLHPNCAVIVIALPSTTGNDLYAMHLKVAIPEVKDWGLNSESIGDIVEALLAVGLNRPQGAPAAPAVAVRMARSLERSMQLLYALAIRMPHVVVSVNSLEIAMLDAIWV